MKYLLDTDHFSVLQRQTGKAYINLAARMAEYPPSDFAISIITIHEQLLGCHAYINRMNRDLNAVVKGYEMMARLISDFQRLPLLSFDTRAGNVFEQVKSRSHHIATMDARIAAIAISHGLILLTRNYKDFSQVEGLAIADWTIGEID